LFFSKVVCAKVSVWVVIKCVFALRCRMACEKKLLHSLDVKARMLQYLFFQMAGGWGVHVEPRCWWLFGCSMWCKCLWQTEERLQWSSLLSVLESCDPRRCNYQTR